MLLLRISKGLLSKQLLMQAGPGMCGVCVCECVCACKYLGI